MKTHYAAWMAILLFCATLFAPAGVADDKQPRPKLTREEKQLEQELRRIDREAQQERGEERVLARLSADLALSEETLRAQKQSTNLSYGNLFIAHSLARATGNTFESIVSTHHNGKAWGQIAQEHNIKLGNVVSNARRSSNAIEAQRRNDARRMGNPHEPGAKGQSGSRPPSGHGAHPPKPTKPPGKPH